MKVHKLTSLFIISCFIAVLSACGGGETEESTPEVQQDTVATKAVAYTPDRSELALLMREMFDENMEIREQIMNGETPKEFSEKFYNLHTANATEPEKINDTYHAMADAYLQTMEGVMEAEGDEAVAAFNNMVTTCVNCHKAVSCQGPIPKINQLRIKTADES